VVAGPVFKTIMDWTYAIDHEDFAIHNASIEEEKSDRSYYKGEVYGFGKDYDEIFADVDVGFEGEGRWIKGGNREDGSVISAKAKISTKTVPDLSGMGLRDAVYVLENLGMDVKVEGSGKVVKQSINSGKNIDNQAIILYLN
jgi:cell division protein FtsI (penicillin-binding protein 3)